MNIKRISELVSEIMNVSTHAMKVNKMHILL